MLMFEPGGVLTLNILHPRSNTRSSRQHVIYQVAAPSVSEELQAVYKALWDVEPIKLNFV